MNTRADPQASKITLITANPEFIVPRENRKFPQLYAHPIPVGSVVKLHCGTVSVVFGFDEVIAIPEDISNQIKNEMKMIEARTNLNSTAYHHQPNPPDPRE